MNKWITIDFKNGEICRYRPDEYTDYQYDGKYFIVIRDRRWIGFYNLTEIRYIEIGTIDDGNEIRVMTDDYCSKALPKEGEEDEAE